MAERITSTPPVSAIAKSFFMLTRPHPIAPQPNHCTRGSSSFSLMMRTNAAYLPLAQHTSTPPTPPTKTLTSTSRRRTSTDSPLVSLS